MDSDDEIPTLIEHKEAVASDARIPLTIICGFLGAGKSTLLKRILSERHGYRIAVIMNEFGDTADIESKTVNVSSPDDPLAEQSEEVLELANGCLCCSIKDTGVAAIEKLMQRKGAFDYILLETTGLADPGPIASMFWQNEEFATGLGRDIVLDSVICVVDAVFGKQQMQEDSSTGDTIGESLRQIAGSDTIILNKVDLVDFQQLATIEDMIRDVNPAAPIHRTIRGAVDLGLILDVSAYALAPKFQPHPADHHHGHDDCSDPNHNHAREPTHYELRGISSLQVSCPALDSSRFHHLDEWIRTVLWESHVPGQDEDKEVVVLRCKGLVTLESGEQQVLQGVRKMYEWTKVDGEVDLGVPEPGKLVLIGKGLDEIVRQSLEAVLG